ncbi:protein odr-4 homolog isoform X1 [Scleropages formosus]|uniref:protein odr-4 homolog isoform X1 n=1 Tax=Scleropages formosus TaxID=113540 RepID=UPI0008785334|nr:protein odr-4 homolog isoform X1 [Scleropages formosus]
MGRGYIVDDSVEKYLVSLQTASLSSLTGLLIGQSLPQRDFVVLAVQTPQKAKSESDPSERKPVHSLCDIDTEWVTQHAKQVSWTLPGGLSVLGVFLITPPDLEKEAQNTLRRLVFSVEKLISKGRLWSLNEDDVSERVGLHICSKTRRAVCRTFDVQDAKSSAKPADWKYQHGVSDSWLVLKCSVELHVRFPTPDITLENLEKSTKVSLQKWGNQIESSICLVNGVRVSSDSELISGQKKNTKAFPSNLRAQILIHNQGLQPEEVRTCASVQVCGGVLALRGVVHCRAYIHSNKPKAKQAAEALKRDIMNTVSYRTEMFFEDLLMSEADGERGTIGEKQPLPQRVFASVPGAGFCVCDYMFPDEGTAEVKERLKETLDCDIPEEEVDLTQEVIAAYSETASEDHADDADQQGLPEPAENQKFRHQYFDIIIFLHPALWLPLRLCVQARVQHNL